MIKWLAGFPVECSYCVWTELSGMGMTSPEIMWKFLFVTSFCHFLIWLLFHYSVRFVVSSFSHLVVIPLSFCPVICYKLVIANVPWNLCARLSEEDDVSAQQSLFAILTGVLCNYFPYVVNHLESLATSFHFTTEFLHKFQISSNSVT